MPRISRRDFLKMIGAGGVGTGAGFLFAESKKQAVEYLVPQVYAPEDFTPGIATWYSSVCRQCDAGCGIMVRTREGRAKKIEGNPNHPVNQGKLCAMGQAGLNGLYNPDRIKTPLRRVGEKGSGKFEEISWADALEQINSTLASVKQEGNGDQVHILSGGLRGHVDKLVANFAASVGTDNYRQYDFTRQGNLYAANKLAFGEEHLPYYDIENSDFLLSFSADFLTDWISPVHHALSFGRMRQERENIRGYFVQIEPRMSSTGASADEWLPAQPGSEGLIALAIANVLVNAGRYTGSDTDAWRSALANYSPAAVSERTEISVDQIERLAERFASSSAPLAIGGGSAANHVNGQNNLLAINLLNYLAGNIGQKGGVIFNASPALTSGTRAAGFAAMQEMIGAASDGNIPLIFVHGTNPVFNLPTAVGMSDALKNVPMIVAMSSFMDETTAMADIILPTNTYLESWADDFVEESVRQITASVSQPVVKPLYDTRDLADIYLTLGKAGNSSFAEQHPWTNAEEYIRGSWEKFYSEYGDLVKLSTFDNVWQNILRVGVTTLETVRSEKNIRVAPSLLVNLEWKGVGESDSREFSLQPYVSPNLHDGRGANLPWLQEMPDPITGIVYSTWVEINPETANTMGVREGDILEVESASGSIRAPAFLFPAIRPDVVAIPIGQGHSEYGRYAKNRGANPLAILDVITDTQSGELAWGATRVTVSRTGERARIIKQSGVPRELGRNITG